MFTHKRPLNDNVTVSLTPDEAKTLLREIALVRDNAGCLNDEPGELGRLQSQLASALGEEWLTA